MKRPKMSVYEWFMTGAKVIGAVVGVFLYGEHQLNSVNAHAESIVHDERMERRQDYQALDVKITEIHKILLRWDREDQANGH